MSRFTKRIVTRLGDDLAAWIHEQAEFNGLDDAGFVRMVLTQRMNGLASVAAVVPAAMPAQHQVASNDGHEGDDEPDVDAVVAERLNEAERSGLARQMSQPDCSNGYEQAPVRSLHQVSRRAGKEWIAGGA